MAIHKFTRAIFEGRPVEIYGDGSSARDYTYIDDIVQAVTDNLENIRGYEIFNLGNSKPVKLLRLVKIIEAAAGKTATVIHTGMQQGDVNITFADILKAWKMLKYNPKITIEKGIEKFIHWYKSPQT